MKLTQEQLTVLGKNDFYTGTYCLTHNLPWLTPDSIKFLDNLLSKNIINIALEIGSGGSTRFFNKRVNSVISVERNKEYCTLPNINHIRTMDELSELLKNHDTFDLIIVDSHLLKSKEYKETSRHVDEIVLREQIFELVIKYLNKTDSICVIDNYASNTGFPNLHKMDNRSFINKYFNNTYILKDFDHPKWAGGSKGTRIIYSKNLKI